MDFTGSPIKIILFVIVNLSIFAFIIFVLSIVIPRFIDPKYKKKQNAWLKENWKWFVPAVFAFIAVFNLTMNEMMKHHRVYEGSVEILQQSEKAKEVLGEPVDLGFFIKGKVSFVGGGRIYYSISGPKGTGTIVAEGRIRQKKFRMLYTDIVLNSGKKIKLMDNN